jgi:hypothetical protein
MNVLEDPPTPRHPMRHTDSACCFSEPIRYEASQAVPGYRPEDATFHSVLATAWKAADEIDRSADLLHPGEIDGLLNAAVAVQKRYFRTPAGKSDEVQQRLFARLTRMSAGRFLPAFEYGISDADLEAMARPLAQILELTCAAVDDRHTNRLRTSPAGRRAKKPAKHLLILGGICKETDRKRIAQALACEVDWLDAKKGECGRALATAAARCHLLVSLIKLSSHAHTDGLSAFSRQSGIPLVRIPAGFNPALIADAVNEQILRVS